MKYWRKPLDQAQAQAPRYRICVLADRCKECGFCIQFCPRNVLNVSAEFNAKGYHPVCADSAKMCAGCGLCEMICPEFAICAVSDEQPGGS